jgi:hypothetical protein
MDRHDEQRPIELPKAAEEEHISEADAAERLEQDPDEQPNYTEPPLVERTHPEDT